MAKKKITALVYTEGKFGKGYREILDTDNPNLYSRGKYPTKITAEDLPEDYIRIHSRVLWYMHGYIKTSGIVDMAYKARKINHMFKDDYLYISYKEKLVPEVGRWGFLEYTNYDIAVCGNSIVPIVLAAEKYSGFDATEIRKQIEDKRIWFRDNQPDDYKHEVGFDEDIFDHYIRNKYVDDKLIPS